MAALVLACSLSARLPATARPKTSKIPKVHVSSGPVAVLPSSSSCSRAYPSCVVLPLACPCPDPPFSFEEDEEGEKGSNDSDSYDPDANASATDSEEDEDDEFDTILVTVHGAKGLSRVEMMSLTDPYAVVTFNGDEVGRTSVKDNTLYPRWENQHILFRVPAGAGATDEKTSRE